MAQKLYDVPPPALTKDDKRHPIHDPRYKSLPEGDLPCTECFKGNVTRFLPYWSEVLAPSLRAGLRPIIAAHGNTLRALIKYVDGISGADIPELETTVTAFHKSVRISRLKRGRRTL